MIRTFIKFWLAICVAAIISAVSPAQAQTYCPQSIFGSAEVVPTAGQWWLCFNYLQTNAQQTSVVANLPNGKILVGNLINQPSAVTMNGDATITNTGALTVNRIGGTAINSVPGSGFLAGLTDVETLTNKTISGASNTLTNIGNSSLVNSATTVNGQSCALGGTCTVPAAASSIAIGVTVTSGTPGYILSVSAGPALSQVATSGSGSVALTTSPVFTTPNLGTPSAATLTNATGLPISSGVSGLGTGVVTALGNSASGSGGPCLVTSCSMTTPTISGASLSGTFSGAHTVSGAVTFSGSVTGSALSTYLASPTAIGGTAAAAGNFTTGGYSGNQTNGGNLTLGSGAILNTTSGNLVISPAGQTTVFSASGNVSSIWQNSSQGTDLKNWSLLNNGNLIWQAVNDVDNAGTNFYQVVRGTTYNVSSHNWYTSSVAGNPLTGMVLNSSSLTVTPGGTADGVTVTGGSSGASIGTNAGTLSIGSTGGTTAHTDATQTMPNLSSSASALDAVCWNATGGALTHNSAGALCSASLRAIKDFDGAIDPAQALVEVNALRPLWARYNAAQTGTSDHSWRPMLVAEDVEQIDKRLATYDETGALRGVAYQFVPVLNSAAIQGLSKSVDDRFESLSKRISILEAVAHGQGAGYTTIPAATTQVDPAQR